MGFVNVLQAKTKDSLSKGLNLHGVEFNWAISITYFATTILLLPSNLLMKRMSGKHFLPLIMAGFGAVSACIAASQNAGGLLASRFFLGVPEAGVVPAGKLTNVISARVKLICRLVIMYFSFWYKPSERSLRIGLFHASNSLAVGTGGFIANRIDGLNGRLGLASWRWLFIIVSKPSILCMIRRSNISAGRMCHHCFSGPSLLPPPYIPRNHDSIKRKRASHCHQPFWPWCNKAD